MSSPWSLPELPKDVGYDIIGDVHGCGNTLCRLLELLGYRVRSGVYRHPQGRKVVFLGDIVDRGPRIREALHTVYAMVEAGEAWMVMGNHEYNAITYCRRNRQGTDFLREHSPRNNRLIIETLSQFANYPDEWDHFLGWFMELPLFLDQGQFRVVHACWDTSLIERYWQAYTSVYLNESLLHESVHQGTFAYQVIERLTRGILLRLPEGMEIRSGDGFVRRAFRAHFWARDPQTYGDVIFQPDNLPDDLEDQMLSALERHQLAYYALDQVPLFIGHYWCEGIPAVMAPNIACVDYSAVKYGRLVAYRWDGEKCLDADKFVWVDVLREEFPNVDALPNLLA